MTRSSVRLARLTAGLVAGGLALAGCSDGGHDMAGTEGAPSSASSSSAGSPAGSAVFDDADVTFVEGMIPHHRGALEMAQLADGRAEDPRVAELADRVEAAQEPEIETMTGWLEEWGEPLPEESHGSMGGMDHGSVDPGDTGMDVSALEDASGAEFDRMFLEMMIVHHRGAVEMAQTEIAEGSNPEAIALAEEIASSQAAEIQEMETLLAELGG